MTKPQTLLTLIGNRTQKAFAEYHGIRPEIISKWLSGDRNISNSNLEKIAKKEGYKLYINYKLNRL